MRPSFLDNMSYAMAEVYGAVSDRIMINLAHHFQYYKNGAKLPGSFEYQARMLAQMGQVNRETLDIIQSSLGSADTALRAVLEASIMDALKNEEPALIKAAQQGLLMGGANIPAPVTPNQLQAFQSYYRQSADKLNLVNTAMLESTQAAYTATVSDVVQKINRTQSILNVGAGEVVTGVSSWNTAMHDAVRKMVQNGLTGFVDHGGHRWTPEAYVAMDIRTTMFNTARAAVWERADSYGADMYQVSSHNGARPLCYPWQGKVISRSGFSGMVEDLDGNKITVYPESATTKGQAAGLFGVNCRHYPMTFIPGFSTLKGEPQDPAENEKTYEESQEQRGLERKLREEKRELAILKAQGADEAAIKAQRDKVHKASEDIDEFCDATGRARRRNREFTPVNATWPHKDSYDPLTFPKDERDRLADWFKNGGNDNNPPQNPVHLGPNNIPPRGRAQIPVNPQKDVAKKATQQTEKPVTIKGATDKQSLFKAVEAELGVKISDGVKELEFIPVKDAFIGVKRIADDFPEILDELKAVELSKSGIMSCTGEKIHFNRAWFDTESKLPDACKKYSANGWWSKNCSTQSIGVHEAAHAIEWYLDTHSPSYTTMSDSIFAWNKCLEAKSIVSEACKAIKKTEFGKGKVNKELIESISRYATENASETLAESFADVYINGDNASPLARLIVKMTTETYKRYGGAGGGN